MMVYLPVDQSVRLQVRKGAVVAGRAYLGDESHPLRRGTVFVRTTGYRGKFTTTDDEGGFTSPTVEAGTRTFVFRHEPHLPVTLELTATHEEPAAGLEVVFMPGLTVTGVLRNLEGEAIPYTRLTWRHVDELEARAAHLSCTTDAEGRFQLSGLRPGRHSLISSPSEREADVVLVADPVQEVEVRMDMPVALRLKVEDQDGEPVIGAEVVMVQANQRAGSTHYNTRTGAGGWCLLAGAEAIGALDMAASSDEGKGELKLDPFVAGEPVTIRLLPKGRVVCKVVDSTGSPVPGAIVVPYYPTGGFATFVGRVVTDAAGSFELVSYPGKVRLEAKQGAHGVGSLEFELEPGQRHDSVVTLGPEHAIRGRVVDQQGNAVQYVRVDIRQGKEALKTDDHMHGGLRTDLNGWFAAKAEDGEYTVEARPEVDSAPPPVHGVRPGGPPLRISLASPGSRAGGEGR